MQFSFALARFLAMVNPAGPEPTIANECVFELNYLCDIESSLVCAVNAEFFSLDTMSGLEYLIINSLN